MSVGIEKTCTLSHSCTGTGAGISLKGISSKGVGDLIVNLVDTVLDWQDRARQRRQMAMMDDHLLRDIGLSRADLECEYEKPFWRA